MDYSTELKTDKNADAETSCWSTVEDAISAVRLGRMVIVVDDEHPDSEGDLLVAAADISPRSINFMLRYARGLVCLALTERHLNQLNLGMMVPSDESASEKLAFAVSIEARHGVTTGISAADRAATVLAAVSEGAKPEDITSPGHVFPLRVPEGGVLHRPKRPEAAVDLVRLAGLSPAGVTCQILREDGKTARVEDMTALSREHDLKMVSVSSLVRYRLRHETLVHRAGEATLPTRHAGSFHSIIFENSIDHIDHLALVKGDVRGNEPVLVRVHSECLTGDAFASLRCDCGDQLSSAMEMVDKAGKGIILYMRQEGRGIGLKNKIRAYGLQDREGLDTVEANERLGFAADQRDYGVAGQILVDLGVSKLKLITNNPRKQIAIMALGLEIVERVPLHIEPNEKNLEYLRTKKKKLGHSLHPKV